MRCEVSIKRMCVYARHGVLPQEQLTGARFYVTLKAQTQVDDEVLMADRLEGVQDYSVLSRIIAEEMAVNSQLLEHVAYRIGQRVLKDCPKVMEAMVEVEKENPPLGIAAEGVGVSLTVRR